MTASASGFVDPPVPAWLRRWRDLRNRLLANGTFQDLAARFPPTRFVARREARALFDLCAGFVYSQTLAACV
ncbi:MAG TPA: methyltransferase, partial [Acidiphilium sp.]|nr:methyltransferase [Acidiphilium sp.]